MSYLASTYWVTARPRTASPLASLGLADGKHLKHFDAGIRVQRRKVSTTKPSNLWPLELKKKSKHVL